MKIHLIKKQTIEDFVERNARSQSSFALWLTAVKFADWNKPADIKQTFNSADLLGNDLCKYFFGEKQAHLFICWIGTHAEYDELCNKNQQYTINAY